MVGVLPARMRFCNLGVQRKVETFESITGIRQTDILCQIVCQLIPDQMGMNYEKRGRQKRPAHFVVPAEKVFRQRKDSGTNGEPERKQNLFQPSNHQRLRPNRVTIGESTKSEARAKLGLIDARKIAVKERAIPYATEAMRRCSRKKQARNWIRK